MTATLTHVDTACALLELGGWRLLTDPVFDPPGRRYKFGWGTRSTKTGAPALTPAQLGAVDAVLLSHHQHHDNLDQAGADYARAARQVLTTRAAAQTLPNARGLAPWERVELPGDDRRGALAITATPARHHPAWQPEFISGPVVGFVLETAGLPGPVYVTGDTTLFAGVREVAARFAIDTLIIHVGCVRFPWLTGRSRYTFDAAEAAEVARLTGARVVVPIHTSGWTHFREGPDAVTARFARDGLADRLRMPPPGQPLSLA